LEQPARISGSERPYSAAGIQQGSVIERRLYESFQ
jgi:hypothetical protein